MIKADELWVGDWLRVMASGQRGRFEKQDPGGKMVLRMKDDRLISFNSEELEISQDEDIPESIEYKRSSEDAYIPDSGGITEYLFTDTIDLHYELLRNLFSHDQGSILDFQKDICERFLEHAVDKGLPHIRIIHGVGQGILKQEVEYLLSLYPEVTLVSSNPNLASIDVWLKQ
ncbi:MAG: Smr/MutS family protein [Saprospiraceae bacterium]|nr:Smr/MutS family protein [Saprospiraceae bacterium]MBK7372159.1 Smr/MutS family protein [Saprospiraceae bacterium]MBK8510987.1 Smr/MutS family protein [Saprospiraceae bacterium]MBK8777904.1 Smr/MutS family protein [Saprospiraceae bacterium]